MASETTPGHIQPVEGAADAQDSLGRLLASIKRELQLIFDGVSETIMLLARDMTIRRVNRAGLVMAGKSSYDEVLGRKCYEVMHNQAEPCKECPVAAVFQDGRPAEREMVGLVAGRTRYRRQRAFPLESATGEQLVVGVVEDVTEQRELKEQTVRSEKLQAVMRLAGALAHEISQPLAAASGRAELLEMAVGQSGSQPPDVRELSRHIESLRSSCRRIAEVVRRLQSVSAYITKPYYGSEEILDLDRASSRGAPGTATPGGVGGPAGDGGRS